MKVTSAALLVVVAALLLASSTPVTAAGRDSVGVAESLPWTTAASPAHPDAANLFDAMSHFWEALMGAMGSQGPQQNGVAADNMVGDGPGPHTVAEALESAPGNVSILVNAVKRAQIQQTIADPGLQATIFVPTNKAFVVALAKMKLTPVQLYADRTKLLDILSYHTVGGPAVAAADLKDGQQLTTINQHQLTVHVDRVAGTTIQGATETAKVLAADICVGQAIIHVVDTVLLPPVAPS